jgi:hypothetical protein
MFQPGLELGRARQKALLKEIEIPEALKPLERAQDELSLRDSLALSLGDALINAGQALRRHAKSRDCQSLPQFSK